MNIPWFRAGAAVLAVLCAPVAAQQIPEVSITAQGFPPKTSEPCPVCLVAPLRMTLTRTGDLTHALNVHLETAGTATSGVDYVPVPPSMEIPAGASSLAFNILPLDDHLVEGPEVVEVRVRDAAIYNAGTPSSAMGVIGDDEQDAPAERLDITVPAHGDIFPSGVGSIRLEALGVSVTREIDMPVEFLANGVVIGQSNPPVFDRMPIPWLPRVHDFKWDAPADGTYTLTARVPATAAGAGGGGVAALESPPVLIRVGEGSETAVVSIIATSRVAEEDSAPTMRPVRYHGVFTISRTGSTTNAQPFYLHVSGTATPGTDYTALPLMGSIPAGAVSTTVTVDAIPDNLAEPLETVIAEVSGCPPDGIRAPCFLLEVDPAHQRDTVLIRDDGITTASLQITAPPKGAHFATGSPVVIDATALDAAGGITRVDFYAGNTKIGTSELFFLVPPPPGEPIYHTFTWNSAPAGTHVLTARAISLSGAPVSSPPVTITVGGNALPAVQITSPGNGAQIPEGQPVHVVVEATDPDGYTDTAEFYANGHKLGEVTLQFLVPPPPGETQTFDFAWNGAPPGTHVLSARVRDDDGSWGTSPPVTIVVTPENALPVITVHARDAFAVEPTASTPANTASFLLRRHGPTADALGVNYTMHGTATNGVDYTALNGFATFPAGEATTLVTLTPLADNLVEQREKAIFQLELQFDDGPERYRLGLRRRAIAVIADRSWFVQHAVDDVCSPLGDGHFHLCFPAAAAVAPLFRIEATDNFLQWETVHEGASADDALHFVDPDTPGLLRRFYRMAPETNAAGP
jgi:hypothetical protein